jgi:hypothetical protein
MKTPIRAVTCIAVRSIQDTSLTEMRNICMRNKYLNFGCDEIRCMEGFTCMIYSNLIRNLRMTEMRNTYIKILQSKDLRLNKERRRRGNLYILASACIHSSTKEPEVRAIACQLNIGCKEIRCMEVFTRMKYSNVIRSSETSKHCYFYLVLVRTSRIAYHFMTH